VQVLEAQHDRAAQGQATQEGVHRRRQAEWVGRLGRRSREVQVVAQLRHDLRQVVQARARLGPYLLDRLAQQVPAQRLLEGAQGHHALVLVAPAGQAQGAGALRAADQRPDQRALAGAGRTAQQDDLAVGSTAVDDPLEPGLLGAAADQPGRGREGVGAGRRRRGAAGLAGGQVAVRLGGGRRGLDVQFGAQRLLEALVDADRVGAAALACQSAHQVLRGPFVARIGAQEPLQHAHRPVWLVALFVGARQG
jgi:hypothetical protein